MAPIIFALSTLSALLGAAQAAPTLHSRDSLQQCGTSRYDPTQYTCYGESLCPVINGESTELCGTACYSSRMYSCNNSVLATLPAKSGPFTLTASNPTAPFNGRTIEASGSHFFIGGNAASYCPTEVGSTCADLPGNTTVLYSGSLDVVVPGGQETYWQTNGALTFTQAHSELTTNVSEYGASVYEGGAYYGPNNEQLIACPAQGVWEVFAQIAGVTFASDCVGFYAVTQDEPKGTSGAWQYI
ncbi:hypothetical protein MBLNU459_g4807t1 [Dothideomycetes sp. NU459]